VKAICRESVLNHRENDALVDQLNVIIVKAKAICLENAPNHSNPEEAEAVAEVAVTSRALIAVREATRVMNVSNLEGEEVAVAVTVAAAVVVEDVVV